MNKDFFEGKWHEIKGKIKEKWAKLTDDDIAQINGKKESLRGKLQIRYGYAKEKAQEELDAFEKSFDNTFERDKFKNSSKDQYTKQY